MVPARQKAIRYSAYLAAIGFSLLVVVEVVLRFKGFGDPPLYELDPRIEYYAKQGSYRRHGNVVRVNAFGMRGNELRARTDQLRMLLIGDSIVFGTYRVGQAELISTFLEPELARLSGRAVEVLNLACSSWGPENQRAYLERFGTFDADIAVWVLSSHDAYDVPVPGFAGLLPQHPRMLALREVYDLYWQKQFQPPPPEGDPIERSLRASKQVVSLLQVQGIPLVVAHHWSSDELTRGMDPEGVRLDQVFGALGVPVFSLKPTLVEAETRGENPLSDSLHLSPAGARAVGVVIARELVRRRLHLESKPAN